MPSPKRSRTRGLTLIEVIASLALLGSLLGGAVLSKARLSRQWTAAQDRGIAVERLDRLLERWWREGDIPQHARGELSGSDPNNNPARLSWSTHPIERRSFEELGIEATAVRAWSGRHDPPQLLASVEVFRYVDETEGTGNHEPLTFDPDERRLGLAATPPVLSQLSSLEAR